MPASKGTSGTAIPNEERRRRNTQRILDVSEQRIVRSGYAAATMDRIAADAEVTKGTLYFYFDSKEALLDALLQRSEDTIFAPALTLLDDRTTGAAERLIAYFNYMGASTDRIGGYLLPVTASLQLDAVPDAALRRIGRLYETIQTRLAAVISDGMTGGEFTPDVPARERAAFITATMDGMLLEWHRRGAQLDGAAFLRAGRRCIAAGLRYS
ncbi:TetR/AcrR family transcriptional regulator [Millisia brevis]|uniref:TetR/AcrR family transcriptional regulator n=1 Tax=Millisia brevis TaxID=264148 RepID=UPI000831792A|nr:TetR/AcrR family transcriptional regulator [Millisia brevis]